MSKRIFTKATPAEIARNKAIRDNLDQNHKQRILAKARQKKLAEDLETSTLSAVFTMLKSARETEGFSLSEMSAKTGMAPEVISRLENLVTANPKIDTVQRYAHALGKKLVVQLVDE